MQSDILASEVEVILEGIEEEEELYQKSYQYYYSSDEWSKTHAMRLLRARREAWQAKLEELYLIEDQVEAVPLQSWLSNDK